MQPFLREVKRNLPDIPLWNPWITAGRPLHADAQSAIFSPFNWIAYVMDEWRALALIAALKLWVAAFGTFLLARALSMRWPGAGLAGLVYGFSLWMITWISYPHASVWALVPWALLAAEGVLRRPSVRRTALLALVIGAAVPVRAPRVELPPARGGRRVQRVAIAWQSVVEAARCRRRRRARVGRAAGGARAAAGRRAGAALGGSRASGPARRATSRRR